MAVVLRRASVPLLAALLFVSWHLFLPAGVSGGVSRDSAPPAPCTHFAATSGSDRGPGTKERPYRTVKRLVASLSAGGRGCLLGGVFAEDVTIGRGGRPGNPLVLRSAPGMRATIVGRVWVTDAANDVVVSGLGLDGRNGRGLPSPTVNGDRITFAGNDVTNGHTAICFNLGSDRYGVARDVVIERNRIHDCGRLPRTNHDHGVYLEATRGVVIRGNWIYDNADRGIQLYPDAQGSLIESNVLDGNGTGVIISGGSDDTGRETASSDNVVRLNVISNSVGRFNVESYWSGPTGTGNVVERNCLWNGARGDLGEELGFDARDNLIADPEFVDRVAKDFRLREASPCSLLGGSGLEAAPVAR